MRSKNLPTPHREKNGELAGSVCNIHDLDMDIDTKNFSSTLLRISPDTKASQIRTLSSKLTVPPAPFYSLTEYFEKVDELAIRVVASSQIPLTDIQIWEICCSVLQNNYKCEVGLHIMRKRLWRLILKHIFTKNDGCYLLHPKHADTIRMVCQ